MRWSLLALCVVASVVLVLGHEVPGWGLWKELSGVFAPLSLTVVATLLLVVVRLPVHRAVKGMVMLLGVVALWRGSGMLVFPAALPSCESSPSSVEISFPFEGGERTPDAPSYIVATKVVVIDGVRVGVMHLRPTMSEEAVAMSEPAIRRFVVAFRHANDPAILIVRNENGRHAFTNRFVARGGEVTLVQLLGGSLFLPLTPTTLLFAREGVRAQLREVAHDSRWKLSFCGTMP